MSEDLKSFLDAANESAEGLSDESWLECMKDAVRDFNTMNKTRYKPHDSVMSWIRVGGTEATPGEDIR